MEPATTIPTSSAPHEQGGNDFMNKTIAEAALPPLVGDLIEGKVIGFGRNTLYVDLAPFGTGIIYGREYLNVRDVIKNIQQGDTIIAKIIESTNDEHYFELSLREARQAVLWKEAEEAIREKKIFELLIKDANKGGLLIDWQGILGFLPASQLAGEHYPRVEDGNKEKIMEELKKLIGKTIAVQMITANPKEEKLIFSERATSAAEKQEIIAKYNLGDVLEGEVTGIVDFGIFIKLEGEIEGLVHISEISWSLVENPRDLYKVGDKVKIKVIEIENGKISLSIKALTENPWTNAEKKYKKDAEVDAVVIKFNKHGALASVEEGVSGLIHVSEFESEKALREALQLGQSYKFKINVFEPKDQKMTLSLVK